MHFYHRYSYHGIDMAYRYGIPLVPLVLSSYGHSTIGTMVPMVLWPYGTRVPYDGIIIGTGIVVFFN